MAGASLFDLLRSGQLPQELPPDPWAQLEEIKRRQEQLAPGAAPGIAVSEPRPDAEMIPTRDVAPRPQVGVPYAPPSPQSERNSIPPPAPNDEALTRRQPAPPVAPARRTPAVEPLSPTLEMVSRGSGIIPDIVKMFTADKRESLTVNVLMNKLGTDRETATLIARNPQVLQQVLTQQFGGAKKQFGLNPVYGTDEKGNTVLMQMHSGGGVQAATLPPGVTPSTGHDKIDLGSHWLIKDKRSGQSLGIVKKDLAGKEREEEIGKAEGKATADLPRIIENAGEAQKVIQQIRAHPGKSTGWAGAFAEATGGIPGSEQRGFVALLKQARGKSFLEAFNMLRGGGAITEIEGIKATEAIARLDAAQSERDFDRALDDLETIIKKGVATARQKAGSGGTAKADPLGLR